jgi:hypothetical protein
MGGGSVGLSWVNVSVGIRHMEFRLCGHSELGRVGVVQLLHCKLVWCVKGLLEIRSVITKFVCIRFTFKHVNTFKLFLRWEATIKSKREVSGLWGLILAILVEIWKS